MSATVPRPRDLPRAALRPRGMVWLAWRRQRAAIWAGAVLVLAGAGFILWQRAGMTAFIDAHHLDRRCGSPSSCDGRVFDGLPYDHPFRRFQARYRDLLIGTGHVLRAGPVVAGVFLGAPLFASEYENDTHRLAWSQSVGRTRWAAAALAVPTALALAGAALLSAACTWWWAPARGLVPAAWYETVPYNVTGPVPVAMTLLAVYVGAAAGLLIRRTLPAMAVTLAGAGGLQLGLHLLHPLLSRPVTRTAPVPASHGNVYPLSYPADSWTQGGGFVTPSGRRWSDTPPGSQCWDWYVPSYVPPELRHCLTADGETFRQYIRYRPAEHLWPLQWAEAGILTAAALALAALCVWWLRHRPA